ncbi:MAG: ferritin [Candidatus Woesearchaeota archaeon]
MLQEDRKTLSKKTKDMKRAIDSLREELEAIDYYSQRADAANNKELKEIMVHNRNEEIEHAAMIIEWLRRNDKDFDKEINDYLFTKEKITEVEEEMTN